MRLVLVLICLMATSTAVAEDRASIPGGVWKPLYPATGEEEVAVRPFLLDRRPVTNQQFLGFVRRHAKWRRGQIAELFADETYLRHWAGPLDLGEAPPDQPVTHVTWWAARAYCADQGARLPTLAEWEFAAAASESHADATADPAFTDKILRWYSQPTRLRAVGLGTPNFYGVYDLHGLIWEWVEDYASEIIVVDNRLDGTVDTSLFCGAGAVGAVRKEDYAAFMRSAHRSALGATHATRSLGFRCASDLPSSSP